MSIAMISLVPLKLAAAVLGAAALVIALLALVLARRDRTQGENRQPADALLPFVVLLLTAAADLLGAPQPLVIAGFLLVVILARLLQGPWFTLLMAVFTLLSAAGDQLAQGTAFQEVLFGAAALALALFLIASILSVYRRRSIAVFEQQRSRIQLLEHQQWLLEQRSQRSTLDLERRLIQMRTAAEIIGNIDRRMQSGRLLFEVAELVRSRFDLYYVGIFLLDENNEYAKLSAGTGEAGRRMLADEHKLAVGGDSMIGQCLSTGQARIALDVGQESRRFNNPYLADTRSELALPIVSGEKILGAMTAQSDRASAFDETDILVLQSITTPLASALENARLISEVQSNLHEIQALHRQYLTRSWGEVSTADAGEIDYTFQSSTPRPGRGKVNVPLVLRGNVIGELEMETDHLELTADEKKLIDSVTAQAALALENARLVEETQSSAGRERMINQFTSEISKSLDLDSVLKATVRELGRLPHVVEVSVHVGSPDRSA